MSYEVIHYFTDLQDSNHPYNAGDIFPRQGMKVSDARIRELSGKKNKQGKPLIKLVEDEDLATLPFADIPKTYTRTDINRMNLEDLRKLADSEGITAETGAEMKKLLIEKFNL